jgi:hypothetical protein
MAVRRHAISAAAPIPTPGTIGRRGVGWRFAGGGVWFRGGFRPIRRDLFKDVAEDNRRIRGLCAEGVTRYVRIRIAALIAAATGAPTLRRM